MYTPVVLFFFGKKDVFQAEKKLKTYDALLPQQQIVSVEKVHL
jgi:hypothetical protein